jgi:hypothetical protein
VPGQHQRQAGTHAEVKIAVFPDWKLSDELVLAVLVSYVFLTGAKS